MHIVAVAWIFVVGLMVAAEASSTQGTLLGALITLVLYGALPLSIVLYVMGTPARRRARLAAEAAAMTAATTAAQTTAPAAADAANTGLATGRHPGMPSGPNGDGRSHAPGAAVTPEREKP